MKIPDKVIEWTESHDIIAVPFSNLIFRAFTYFPPEDTKVIIIGQDPYPNPSDACGLAFSVEHEKYPPSLRNIFKELKDDLGCEIPKTGNLEPWAKQGVLLLNSILTVGSGHPLSHKGLGWEEFTTRMIQTVIDKNRPLVIITWGNSAKEKLTNLRLHGRVLHVHGNHPSPRNLHGGFFGGRYFSIANNWLEKHDVKPIDWKL
jgi:uracil-DNA glycosylase